MPTPRFTDFFTDFEKKRTVLQSNDIADHLITDVLGERREYQGRPTEVCLYHLMKRFWLT